MLEHNNPRIIFNYLLLSEKILKLVSNYVIMNM